MGGDLGELLLQVLEAMGIAVDADTFVSHLLEWFEDGKAKEQQLLAITIARQVGCEAQKQSSADAQTGNYSGAVRVARKNFPKKRAQDQCLVRRIREKPKRIAPALHTAGQNVFAARSSHIDRHDAQRSGCHMLKIKAMLFRHHGSVRSLCNQGSAVLSCCDKRLGSLQVRATSSDRRRNTPKSAHNLSESLCAGLWVPCQIFWACIDPALGTIPVRNRRSLAGS